MDVSALGDSARRLAELVESMSRQASGGEAASGALRPEVPQDVSEAFARLVDGPAGSTPAAQPSGADALRAPAPGDAPAAAAAVPSPDQLLSMQFEANMVAMESEFFSSAQNQGASQLEEILKSKG